MHSEARSCQTRPHRVARHEHGLRHRPDHSLTQEQINPGHRDGGERARSSLVRIRLSTSDAHEGRKQPHLDQAHRVNSPLPLVGVAARLRRPPREHCYHELPQPVIPIKKTALRAVFLI
ncbi:MAG: hypothetical protein JWP06_238 [Candidatus Saccharibacteria bacterium]|nr:hypothetical protein [Candidatus Saccharibacteria bacterium]